MDTTSAATVAMRLEHLFTGCRSYGNYSDIQALWDQYNRSADPKERKDLLARIQRSIHDRAMFIPLIKASTPSAVGPG
jgi:ABC-type transport system substrate-binding protein